MDPKENKSQDWLEGYKDGLWCLSFDPDFPIDPEKLRSKGNAEYQAGFDEGHSPGS